MRTTRLIAAVITATILSACSAQETAPATYTPTTTRQAEVITPGEVGKPFYVNDRYGDGPIEVNVSTLEAAAECLDGDQLNTTEPGDTLVTIGADLGAIQATATVDTPQIKFFDADGYQLNSVVTYCTQPENTRDWMAITITPGDKARASSTYQVTGEVSEVRIGNHSFTGEQIGRAD